MEHVAQNPRICPGPWEETPCGKELEANRGALAVRCFTCAEIRERHGRVTRQKKYDKERPGRQARSHKRAPKDNAARHEKYYKGIRELGLGQQMRPMAGEAPRVPRVLCQGCFGMPWRRDVVCGVCLQPEGPEASPAQPSVLVSSASQACSVRGW